MRQQRTRLAVNVGNLLETVGAGLAIYGVSELAGPAWALIAAAVLLVVGAELVYDSHVWRIPLPHRPQPRQRLRARRQRLQMWRLRRMATWRRWRADRQDRAWTGGRTR